MTKAMHMLSGGIATSVTGSKADWAAASRGRGALGVCDVGGGDMQQQRMLSSRQLRENLRSCDGRGPESEGGRVCAPKRACGSCTPVVPASCAGYCPTSLRAIRCCELQLFAFETPSNTKEETADK